MDGASSPPLHIHTDTSTAASLETKPDEHIETETPVEVVNSEQWNNETILNDKEQSTALLNNNDTIISRPATSKQLNIKKTTETAWQNPHSVNIKPRKKKTQAPTAVKMSYFDSPVEITTPVVPKQRQTNYKMKKKKKAPIVKSTPLNNNNKNATSVDSIQTMVDGAVQLTVSSSDGLSDDKVDMSKLSLTTSSLPVSSKVSAKSDVSMVRITRHVDHSNISKRVSDSSTSDTIKSDITNSDTNDDFTTTTTNSNSVTNNTSTGISVKSVNYDSAEINNVPHSQKKIGHSSPNSRSSRKSKLVMRWYIL